MFSLYHFRELVKPILGTLSMCGCVIINFFFGFGDIVILNKLSVLACLKTLLNMEA